MTFINQHRYQSNTQIKFEIKGYASRIFTTLLDLIPGFIWEGKEAVLEALATLCTYVTLPTTEDEGTERSLPVLPQVLSLLLTEVGIFYVFQHVAVMRKS